MNAARLHLLLNHAPVFGIGLGVLALLLAALLFRGAGARRNALAIVLLSALAAVPVYLSGEPAEDLIEGMPGVSKGTIETHEEAAKVGFVAILVAGAASLAGLLMGRRPEGPSWRVLVGCFLLALAAAGLLARAAHFGGLIRHPEMSGAFAAPAGHGAGHNDD